MIKGKKRRAMILDMLETKRGTRQPINGTVLSELVGVSRQIVVGDIALLRMSGVEIISTPRGYLLPGDKTPENPVTHMIVCVHGSDATREELHAIVAAGGTVESVVVEHPVYGRLTAELKIASLYDADTFCRKVRLAKAAPLSSLTEGVHTHKVTFPDEQAFEKCCEVLKNKGILVSYC